MKHKISILLALCLAWSILPGTAFAAVAGLSNFKTTRDYPGFSDVAASQWYADDVQQAYELGLMSGKGNGKFDPDGNLTVAEAITMSVQIHATYYGNTFVPGGNPWYTNAVTYAVNNKIIPVDRYSNYETYASRLDLVRLFMCIPLKEFPRINRVSWVPDAGQFINSENHIYAEYIYRFYGAGVLTGDSGGAFRPEAFVKRSEAAAIINRIVLPQNRVHLSSTASAPGQIYSDPNGYFKVTVPYQNWTIKPPGTNDDADFVCYRTKMGSYSEEDAIFGIITIPKSTLDGVELSLQDVSSLTQSAILEGLNEEFDTALNANNATAYEMLVRGLDCYCYEFNDLGPLFRFIYTENSIAYYCILLGIKTPHSAPEIFDILYSVDIPL